MARVYMMRPRFAGIVPMTGVDTYLRGRRMIGKLLGVVPVADGKGEELDIGELATYLNDAILLAPSFLLTPATSWEEVDDGSFDVTLVIAAGPSPPGSSSTSEARPATSAPPIATPTCRRASSGAEWTTPVSSWGVAAGRPLPGRMSAIWRLPDGPLPYVEGRLVPGSVAYNVPPGA